MKRLISFILVLSLLLGVLPSVTIETFAAENEAVIETSDSFTVHLELTGVGSDIVSSVTPEGTIYYAACGDSITHANHALVEDIDVNDAYYPIDGYSGTNYARKNYAYYIAQGNDFQWANYGYGGTTLHHCYPKGYGGTSMATYPFVDDRMTQLKEDIEWDYISIFFGYNDVIYGPAQQRDFWLTETYGEELGYPVKDSQIGAEGFANAEQKAACDAATGYVDGVEYTDNTEYFFAKFLGTVDDTQTTTFLGAYNCALDYLTKKYPNAKILIVNPYVSGTNNTRKMLRNGVSAIAEKWGVSCMDFSDLSYWFYGVDQKRVEFPNPHREDGRWYAENGKANFAGTVEGFNRARFTTDGTHPSNLGYQTIAKPIERALIDYDYTVDVLPGEPFEAELVLDDVYSDMEVSVTMGGTDITDQCYANGKIRIASVTGNIVICANGYITYTDGHTYSIKVTAPTCTEQGYTTYTCECGDSYVSDYVDATGHTYQNGICTGCGGVAPGLEGKKLSILGASISTYTGISNNTEYNSTIGSNAVYYTEGKFGVYADDTWWMQAANDLGLELLVNNSWSGSSLLYERNGTLGAYVDRCVQLHNNDGEEPDIIAIQMGTNDFQYYKDTLGTANIDYSALILGNGDGTYSYAEPTTSLEAAAIVLHKISVRYPNAEVYYLNISQRVDGTDELIQSFNAELKQVVEHFGAHIVDIYGSAIATDHFDTYIGDGRVHPNKMGMDAYTEAFKRSVIANTNYSVDTHTVSLELDDVTADYGDDKIVVSGDAFSVDLTADDSLNVTVTMGGEDITSSAYADGTVRIDAVTADVTITATSVHIPQSYRWEFDGSDLACVEGGNTLTKNDGTTTDGVFSNTRYALETAVVLKHDLPWTVEWKCEGTFQNSGGSTGARIFTSDDVNANYNARYIFKSNKNGLIAMGEKTTTGSHNYGIALGDYGIDWTEEHIYRLENRIADDGGNMVYFFVDGMEIGAMNHYYVGTTDKGITSDWLSGKDFVFPYMGTDTHGFTNASIEYINISEDHFHTYTPTVTAPTCIEQGYTTYTCECGDSYVSDYVEAYGLHDVDTDKLYNTITVKLGQLDSNTAGDIVDSNIYGYVVNYPLKKGHVLSISNTDYVFSVRKLENGSYSTMLKSATADSYTATEDMTVAMLVRKPDKSALSAEDLANILIYDSQFGMIDVEGSVKRFTVEAETIDGGTATTRAALFLPESYSDNGDPTRLIVMTNGYHAHLTDSVWNANTVDDVGVMKHYLDNGYAVMIVDNTNNGTTTTPDWGNPQLVDSYWKAYDHVQANFNVEEMFSIHSRSMGTFAAIRLMREHPELVKCAVMCGPVLSLKSRFSTGPAFLAKRYGFDDLTGATWEADKVVGYDPYTDVNGIEYALPPTFWMLAQADAINTHLTTIEKIENHGNDVTQTIYTETDHSGVCRLNIEACRVDSLAFLEKYQDAHSEHRFCAWETTKEATCTEAGEMRRYCADCEYYESMEIPALDGHVFENGETVCTFCGVRFDVVTTEITLNPGQFDNTTGAWVASDVYGCFIGYELKAGHTLTICNTDYVFAVRQLANGNYNNMVKSATTDPFVAEEDMIISVRVRKPDKSALTEEELAGIVLYDTYYAEHSHSYENGICTGCGTEHPNLANYEGKVISILSASTSTFAGWIPTADGFNLEHRARYPQDNLFSDVESTWWHQLITQLGAKLGINDSWAGSQVLNTLDTNSGDLGPDACMASLTRIQNLGANGTPDVILFFGAGNDMGRGVTLGSFDPAIAPTEVDLTTTKWDTLADAYVATIMRLQYYYPNAEIIVMTTYAMPSYVTAAKLDTYAPVLQAICDHYGVKTVDLRNSGVTFDMLPDNIHPNAEGMDLITEAVMETLLSDVSMEAGENVVYSVEHNLINAQADLRYYKGISAGARFTESVSSDEVTVIMGGIDVTESVYADGVITIDNVTGDIVVTIQGRFDADGHLQQLPEDMCAGTNLWTTLVPENIYYTASGWGNTSAGTTWSITIPVQEGDRIWATSLGAYPDNGSSANGVRITWFDENGVLATLDRKTVYAEFAEYCYVTAPEGAVALNLPMTNNQAHYSVYILSVDHNYANGTCIVCGESQPGPVITKQPESVQVALGEKFSVTVEAQGEDLTYQWYYKHKNATNFTASSFKSSSYTMTMASYCHNREIYCVITDANGNSVTTDTVTITALLTIISQPSDVEVAVGEKISVSVQALGDGLTYQWYYKNIGGKAFAVSSFKTRSYSMTMQEFCHQRQIYCVVTDAYGNSVTSQTVTITRPPVELVILSQPQDTEVEIGQQVQITVKAQGEGLTYQWYYKNSGASAFRKSGFTGNTYGMTMAEFCHNRQVYCVITDKYGNSVTTEIATMTRPARELTILEQPTDIYASVGEDFSVTFAAQGDGLRYQWYYKDVGGKVFRKSTFTGASYSMTMASWHDGRQLCCIVTDKYGNQIRTEIITLWVIN